MNIAIILAGGSGQRMGSDIPKQFIEVNGKPIIIFTMDIFQSHPLIDAIVLVCKETWMDRVKMSIEKYDLSKVAKVVKGGDEIQKSIYNGLQAADELVRTVSCSKNMTDEDSIVLIHDSVRPIIDYELITANIENARKYGNSITVAPPSETFIISDGDKPQLFPRENVHIVRAPQCFHLHDILRLHNRASEEGKTGYSDCCSLLCEYRIPFHETMGDSMNIKITYPADIVVFRALMQYRESLFV